MKFFLHDTRIRIINDSAGWQEWQGTPAEFLALEPEYPGLPEGMIMRYQTEELQYVSDGQASFDDTFEALPYCENIGEYPAWSPEDPESLINDAITSTAYTWSSDKIDAEIASSGGGGANLPVGVALIWFAATAPENWYLADGTAVNESLPIGAWALSIGMISNGNGTVNLPDMRLRVPMMAGTGFALLSIGGEASVTLNIADMPAHDHDIPSSYDYGSNVRLTRGGTSGYSTTQKTLSRGGGGAHNNLQPYYTINFIIFGG